MSSPRVVQSASWHIRELSSNPTHHQLTRHTRLVTQSTRHKRAHNKTTRRIFYLHACQVAPRNSAQYTDGVITASEHTRHTQCRAVWFGYLGLMCATSKSPTTANLLSATNARSKCTVNSSQCRQTRRSTRHTIWRCDELTLWRVDWFPHRLLYLIIHGLVIPATHPCSYRWNKPCLPVFLVC